MAYQTNPTNDTWRAVSEAFDSFQRRLIRVLGARLGGPQDAAQIIGMALFCAVKQFDVKNGYVVLGITGRVIDALDPYLRHERRWVPLGAPLDEDRDRSPEDNKALRLVVSLVEKASDSLSSREIRVLGLYLEGFSRAEIAAKVSKEEGKEVKEETVKKTLQRVQDKLRAAFG